MKLAPTEPEHYLTKGRLLKLSQPHMWLPLVALFSVGAWLQGIHFGWLWLVCALYLTLPYGFFMHGVLDGARHQTFRLEFWVVTLAFNIPFWLYIWAQGPADMGLWLVGMLALGAVYDLVNVQVIGVPVLDIFAAAFMTLSPFVLGAFQSDSGMLVWLPACIALGLWLIAEYLRYDMYTADNVTNMRSTARMLGPEKVLMVCLGIYLIVMVLPTLFYGWYGLPVSIILSVDIWYMITLLPHRTRLQSAHVMRINLAMRRAHYARAVLIGLYLLVLQNRL